MRRISSRQTFFQKRIFPIIWFGGVAFIFLVTIFSAQKDHPVPPPFFIMPIFMGGVGYFIMKKLILNLMDEVFDFGDFLVAKNKGQEVKIPLSNIKNISYMPFVNPRRVTLSLREPNEFGDEISFSPQILFTLNWYGKNPMVEDLINRVDQAKSK